MRRPRLWFVVPIHGRTELTAICLRQLRRTCDALIGDGVDATAVVIGDEQNLEEFRWRTDGLGFGVVRRDNTYLSRKFNDGVQLALDPRHNSAPADYVVPFGSDDWIDHRILLGLPGPDTVFCFQQTSCVREDGQEIAATRMASLGGCGIRIYPRQMMEQVGYRPADEDRRSGCDTSILVRLMKACKRVRVEYRDMHGRQIVDWKTAGQQLNPYSTTVRLRRVTPSVDPFAALAVIYPDDAIAEMHAYYAAMEAVAA